MSGDGQAYAEGAVLAGASPDNSAIRAESIVQASQGTADGF